MRRLGTVRIQQAPANIRRVPFVQGNLAVDLFEKRNHGISSFSKKEGQAMAAEAEYHGELNRWYKEIRVAEGLPTTFRRDGQSYAPTPLCSSYNDTRNLNLLCKEGRLDEALGAAEHMVKQGIPLSRDNAYHLVLRCSKYEDLAAGRRVYALMCSSELQYVAALGDHLIRLFASHGCLAEVNQVFDKIQNPSVYTWRAIITAYIKLGNVDKALEIYQKMQASNAKCNNYVYVAALNACACAGALSQGKLIHLEVSKNGFDSDVFIGNALIDMYAKCHSLDEARKVFDTLTNRDVVSWGSMIAGYARQGKGHEALEIFEEMLTKGFKPNRSVFLSTLEACSKTETLEKGRRIHTLIKSSGLELDMVLESALVDMYGKCGSVIEARKVFDQLSTRDVVSWSALISGYAQHENGQEALRLYKEMLQECVQPDNIIFASILRACGNMAAIGQGRKIHAQIRQCGLVSNLLVGNSLIDMYSRCGSLHEARTVFNELPNRDLVSWGTLIGGYARLGECKLVRQCLDCMQLEGLKPDKVIFISILAACSHKGLVDEGNKYFNSMVIDYGITPSIEHYNCMIDLLGRSGCLSEAEEFIQSMPMPPDILGWRSLLNACKNYGDVERGRRCFDHMVQLGSKNASGYVLMSNLYADAHMWEDSRKIDEIRRSAGAWKKPARAWIEVNDKVHSFIVNDRSHPQSDSIYSKLKSLSLRMKDEGYVPNVELVLKPMSNEDKEDALCGHVEKLAIAFGLVSTPGGTTLRAAKSLRVCKDCHNATKIISKLEKREIIIRDAYRLHIFKDGHCSCGDYH